MQAHGDSENKEDFEVFVRSSFPGKRWGGGRVVFFIGENGPPSVKRDDSWSQKPAMEMLQDLQRMLPDYENFRMEVTVLQNASPSASCSWEYLELVNKARELGVDLRLHLAFVALYKVRRPSRAWWHTFGMINLPLEVHQENVRGLQSLRDKGVELRVFGIPDWQRLRQLLGLLPEWRDEGIFEDASLSGDLQGLLDEDIYSYAIEEWDEEQYEFDGRNEEDVEYQHWEAPEELTRKGEFLMFWDNGVHGVHWRPGARAIYVIEGQEASQIFSNTDNDGDNHAEAHLLRDLKKRLSTFPYTDIKVTVYQNLSPCGSCCEKYDTFLTSYHGTIKLTIKFSRFYKIRRPSCAQCNLHFTPTRDDHYSVTGGLRRLRDRGVALHCFQEQDWVALHQHLQVPGAPADYASSRRKVEDDLMAQDAKEVFGFDMVARTAEGEGRGVLGSDQELATLQRTLMAPLEERLQRIEIALWNLLGQQANVA